MAIDTSTPSQGKETYNLVINSADKVTGTNNNGTYNVDYSSLLRHFPANQKFRLKWSLSSIYTATTTSVTTHHTFSVYVDFGTRNNQQDTKGNNSIDLLGFGELVPWHPTNTTLRHSYENTYTTITKPINSQISVLLKYVDESGLYLIGSSQVPNFSLKIELQPIYDE